MTIKLEHYDYVLFVNPNKSVRYFKIIVFIANLTRKTEVWYQAYHENESLYIILFQI